jgi:hypothetical protein
MKARRKGNGTISTNTVLAVDEILRGRKRSSNVAVAPEVTVKVPKKAAAPKAKKVEVVVPELQRSIIKIRIQGETRLVCHRFSEKARKMILDKQMKVARKGKEAKNPEEDFRASLYPIPGKKGKYGFPSSAFKKAAIAAGSFTEDVTKVLIRGAFHVLGDLVEIEGSEPVMREDMVRLNGMTADIRHRAEFPSWSCVLTILYNPAVISPSQIVNLFNLAGFSVGVGENRPGKTGDTWGLFSVKEIVN